MLTLHTLLPWFLSAVTGLTMWMAGNKDIRAWYLGIVAQFFWVGFDIYFDAMGLLPVSLMLFVIYINNIRKWKAEVVAPPVLTPLYSNRVYPHQSANIYPRGLMRVAHSDRYPPGTILQNMSLTPGATLAVVEDHVLDLIAMGDDSGRWLPEHDIRVAGEVVTGV